MKFPFRSGGVLVGACVSPRGVFAVVCRQVKGGVEALREINAPQKLETSDAAARFLARTLRDHGLAGARVCLVLRGFGSSHHVLQLPLAEDALLRPIVEREVRRVEPDVADPVVNYASAPSEDAPGRALVFVIAAPRTVVAEFTDELSAQGIRVEHLTVAPQVVRRLYDEMDGGEKCTEVILTLPDGPLLAFFIEGELRLVVEPPGDGELDVASLGEESELGALYVRQQFRGAEVERVVTVLGERELEAGSVISDRLGVPVERLGERNASPSALLALGAAMDAIGGTPLSLGGATLALEQRRRPRPMIVRAAYMAAAAVVVWLSIELLAFALTQRELRSVRSALRAYDARYVLMRDVAGQRQNGLQTAGALADVRLDQLSLRHDLAALRASTQPGIIFDSVTYARHGEAWQAKLSGVGLGRTNAQAVQLLHAFYRSFPTRVAAQDVSLDQLEYGDSASAPSVRFLISFSAPVATSRDR